MVQRGCRADGVWCAAVKPWVEIGRSAPTGFGQLSLHRRDQEFVIRVDGAVLMQSRQHDSEKRLAEIGCARLDRAPRVLIGGLGMGFTVRATLDLLPADGTVLVAELVAEVVEWNRTALADLAGRPLDDPRAQVFVGDVGAAMRRPGARFDAILIDVDNSPDALTSPGNRNLYGAEGLVAARRALRPGGCLAVWSASAAPELAQRMERVGFTVEVHVARADRGRGSRHVIYAGWAAPTEKRRR
jgi:spermidine synthase